MKGRWRIVRLDADEPQHARDCLASHFGACSARRRRPSRTRPCGSRTRGRTRCMTGSRSMS
ncbi:DUF5954 family protein [Micromonospora sp. NPDC007220]|uniref:DUF5954 family protein n=1 Tax=unclassified Micromonospora TaxID=2617518 RepID=UPI0033CFDB13